MSLGALNGNRSTVENQHNKSQTPDQVNNLVNTCGIAFQGSPFPGTGHSPCTRFISIAVDSITSTGLSTPGGVPIQTTPAVFQTLFAEGLIQCTAATPGSGASACITPADVAPLGIIVANNGQLSPLAAVFSNPPNFRPPQSQQASLGIEREITPGFSIGVSGI